MRATLTGGCGGRVAVREIVGPNDRAAADFHLPGQPVETLPGLPSTVNLGCDLPILRLAGLATLAAAAIHAARRPLTRPMQVERIPHDLRPNAQRP